jgi:hypothetical protein
MNSVGLFLMIWQICFFLFLFFFVGSRATGAGGAEQLEPEERSDKSRGAQRLEQGEQSDCSRGSGATIVG